MVQSAFSLTSLIILVPFYNVWMNCLYAGFIGARFMTNIIFLVAMVVNPANDNRIGMGLGFGAMGLFVTCFVFFFLAFRVYALVVKGIVRKYDADASKTEVKKWSLLALDMIMRLESRNEDSRDHYEKLVELAGHYKVRANIVTHYIF